MEHRNPSSASRADKCGRKDRLAYNLMPFHSQIALLWQFNVAGNTLKCLYLNL